MGESQWKRGEVAANTFTADEVALLCQILRQLARSGSALARSEAFGKLYQHALAMEESIKKRRETSSS